MSVTHLAMTLLQLAPTVKSPIYYFLNCPEAEYVFVFGVPQIDITISNSAISQFCQKCIAVHLQSKVMYEIKVLTKDSNSRARLSINLPQQCHKK